MVPLQLAQPSVDSETVAALEKLVEEAKRGRVVGIAYIALRCGRDYSGDVVGRAEDHPLLTRGIAQALSDLVAQRTQIRKR